MKSKPKKRNCKYIAQLDQRLSSVKMKLEKQKKLKKIKEKEIEEQCTDRPTLSEGTKRMIQKGPLLNVFDRQQVLIQAKNTFDRQNLLHKKYNKIEGITHRPQINEKSKSMQRTIEDLYKWQLRKQNKLKAERNKTASPVRETFSSNSKSSKKWGSPKVEDRLIDQGVNTRRKIEEKKRKIILEMDQLSSPKINHTYPSKFETEVFHTHFVDAQNYNFERQKFLDNIKRNLSMSPEKGWTQLSMLERNKIFLKNKQAKIKRELENKMRKEIEN
jgi:hypothetical protein